MDIFNHYLPWTTKRISQLSQTQWQKLFAPCEGISQDQVVVITNLMVLLYTKANGFIDLARFKNRAIVTDWFLTYGRSIYNIDALEQQLEGEAPVISSLKKGGVNLIGYNRGRLGLGEDIRGYAALLENLGKNYTLVHIGHPTDDPYRLTSPNESPPIYDKSIFFLNPIEAQKLVDIYQDLNEHYGRCVLVPPWELNIAPEHWQSSFSYFEQVWGISDFTTQALMPLHDNVSYCPSVILAPNPIDTLKAPSEPFTFLFIFDAASYLSRKNPLAVIHSFQLAFDRSENVQLMLKVSNLRNNEYWERLKHIVDSDRRIRVVDGLFSTAKMEQLWSQADCYVSLHRSEGLGRTIAEALLRKLPVVSTAWSGSCDLFPADYPLLVESKLVDVDAKEYPFNESAKWADADISDAAKKMRLAYTDRCTKDSYDYLSDGFRHVSEHFGVDRQREPLIALLNT